MSPQERVDPHTYVGRGYAMLLMVLGSTMRAVQHANIEDRRGGIDRAVWRWMARVQFNTAEMLAEGIDPWAPLGPGELSWDSVKGREAIRAKAIKAN